jgi:hypothetical protein
MSKRQKKNLYYIELVIAILSCLWFSWQIVNVSVSLKYETTFEDQCTSKVNGDNLCNQLIACQIISVVSLIVSGGLLIFRKKITSA